MKLNKLTAALALCAVTLSGCATTDGGAWGTKQTWGTVIGTVGGAILGSQFGGGSGRVVATLVGALAGSALGNWIGSNLDEKDRQALAASTHEALQSGGTVNWASEHSGASAVIRPVSSKTVTQEATVKRAPTIQKVNELVALNAPYEAVKSVNLRAGPNTSAEKVGGFLAGQSFTALGKTNNNWIAVGRKGTVIGYVHAPLVQPVQTTAHKTKIEQQGTDLDSISVAQANTQGFDLDAFEPKDAVSDKVAVQTTCRTMQYELQTNKGNESKTIDACQSADGAWQIG